MTVIIITKFHNNNNNDDDDGDDKSLIPTSLQTKSELSINEVNERLVNNLELLIIMME